MLLTLERLHELTRALEQARRDATGPGKGAWCPAARRDDDGNDTRTETRRRRDGATDTLTIPLGAHGRAFLAVDPETGAVRCAECQDRARARPAKKK